MFNTEKEYIKKALSKDNIDEYGDTRYVPTIRFCQAGDEFCFELQIPRQSNNSLGLSIFSITDNKDDAIDLLKFIIEELQIC